jgi:flagellin-specific chaperone FliS
VEREEEIQQVTGKMITVSDVINSSAFQADMDAREEKIQKNVEENLPTASEIISSLKLTVNFETGHLEY